MIDAMAVLRKRGVRFSHGDVGVDGDASGRAGEGGARDDRVGAADTEAILAVRPAPNHLHQMTASPRQDNRAESGLGNEEMILERVAHDPSCTMYRSRSVVVPPWHMCCGRSGSASHRSVAGVYRQAERSKCAPLVPSAIGTGRSSPYIADHAAIPGPLARPDHATRDVSGRVQGNVKEGDMISTRHRRGRGLKQTTGGDG